MRKVKLVCRNPESGGFPLTLEGWNTDLERMLVFMEARGFTELLELWEGPELGEKTEEMAA